MGDHPDSKGSQTGRADDAGGEGAALAHVLRDVERCEALIAHGARTAAPVEDADIEIVRATRHAVEQKTLSAADEADFRAAVGRIDAGDRDYEAIECAGREALEGAQMPPDYFSIRNAADLSAPANASDLIVLTAVRLGRSRLIDNLRARRP